MKKRLNWHPVRCLYCEVETGSSPIRGRLTVCSSCVYGPRDEAREIAAGMKAWVKPQGVLGQFLGHVEVKQ